MANLLYYKGDKGDKGAKGDKGDQGVGIFDLEINNNGELIVSLTQGAPINAGKVPGTKGDKGDVGPQGPQGPRGDKGDVGPQGPAGADSTVPGPVGPQGPKGDKGDKGDAGSGLSSVTYDKLTGKITFVSTDKTLTYVTDDIRGDSIKVKGWLDVASDLPTKGESGDMYIIPQSKTTTGTYENTTIGHGHVWDGQEWDDIGPIQGPPGKIQSINGISETNVTLATDHIEEGARNLYFTEKRARDSITVKNVGSSASILSYDPVTGIITFQGVAVGEVWKLFNVVKKSGDGNLVYNNTTGLFTYTGPSETETRTHFSAEVVKNKRADGSEQLVGNLIYDKENGKFTYTCPTTADLRSLIEVSPMSSLRISDDGVFSTNSSTLPNQIRIGPNAGVAAAPGNDPTVSIGLNAGKNKQIKNSIIINALNEALNTPSTNVGGGGLYIKPIRSVNDVPADEREALKLQYNKDTGEIYYSEDSDYLDQGLRTTDDVTFGSVRLGPYDLIADPVEAQMAYNNTTKKPVYYNGTKWCYFDGTYV